MKVKSTMFVALFLAVVVSGFAFADELGDLKKKLEEAEATIAMFAENLANCSEELEACEKRNLIRNEHKKEIILKLKELLRAEEDMTYLYKLSEIELEGLFSLTSRALGRNLGQER